MDNSATAIVKREEVLQHTRFIHQIQNSIEITNEYESIEKWKWRVWRSINHTSLPDSVPFLSRSSNASTLWTPITWPSSAIALNRIRRPAEASPVFENEAMESNREGRGVYIERGEARFTSYYPYILTFITEIAIVWTKQWSERIWKSKKAKKTVKKSENAFIHNSVVIGYLFPNAGGNGKRKIIIIIIMKR